MAGNPGTKQPFPSISNITKVCNNLSEQDAIIIAQSEMACLDDISLNGDISNDISDTAEDREKDILTGI
jgi:hypothetical protein